MGEAEGGEGQHMHYASTAINNAELIMQHRKSRLTTKVACIGVSFSGIKATVGNFELI